MIGLDSSGLSDPFLKIKFYNQSVTGQLIRQTNNPAWNTTLYLNEVFLYGNLQNIIQTPPEIIVEILDDDFFVRNKLFFIRFELFF